MGNFEQSIVRHIDQFLANEKAAHILCPHAYHCQHIAFIIREHFPQLEIGGPIEELPWLKDIQPKNIDYATQPVMIGSISSMCILYLREQMSNPREPSLFSEAIALVFNYDADEMGQSLCCLGEDLKNPINSLHVSDFLSIYKETLHLKVQFPTCKPYWDFESGKPVF